MVCPGRISERMDKSKGRQGNVAGARRVVHRAVLKRATHVATKTDCTSVVVGNSPAGRLGTEIYVESIREHTTGISFDSALQGGKPRETMIPWGNVAAVHYEPAV